MALLESQPIRGFKRCYLPISTVVVRVPSILLYIFFSLSQLQHSKRHLYLISFSLSLFNTQHGLQTQQKIQCGTSTSVIAPVLSNEPVHRKALNGWHTLEGINWRTSKKQKKKSISFRRTIKEEKSETFSERPFYWVPFLSRSVAMSVDLFKPLTRRWRKGSAK